MNSKNLSDKTIKKKDERKISIKSDLTQEQKDIELLKADEKFEEVIEKLKKYHPSDNFDMVRKAYDLAKKLHENQFRRSGEPYIIHPVAVANILADLQMDKETIICGLLHDVVEDTDCSLDELSQMFSPEIASIVDGVTKLGQMPYTITKEEIQVENYRKMFLAMAKDIRVIIIKLADRLHNLRTLEYMSTSKQREKADESLNIYAPLAHRLGISKIKVEMEDLSLKYLEPEAYRDIQQKIDKKYIEREAFVNKIIEEIKNHLDEVGIKADVYGRPKHFFSIYKKMINQNKTIDQIYDLFAVRVIVESVKDCYGVFGIVHEMYKPIPGRFKDYIAMPKPNNYQSLHTTLMGPEGEPFEIQIRTYEMHKIAEYGIAAHWKYKEGHSNKSSKADLAEEKLNWLRQILEWQRDISDNDEFLDVLKTDLDVFSDQVYAFTPAGDLITLPAGSTPIDFAYSIHSAVGNKMVGARVNSKIVTFDYKIKNGDRIEIMTSQNSKGPSRDWLNIVKSSQAKNKINAWYRKQFKKENIEKGIDLLERYCKSKGHPYNQLMNPKYQKVAYTKYGFKNWEALCAAVGHGGLKEGQIINRLLLEYERDIKANLKPEEILKNTVESVKKKSKKGRQTGVIVRGMEDLAVRFSKCCTPVPGDEIIGFVTRGRGISIHRTDCTNIISLPEDARERLIEAEWPMDEKKLANISYQVHIQILAVDRKGLVTDISRILTDADIQMTNFSAKSQGNNTSLTDITMEIKDKDQLEDILKKINNLKDVYEVIRTRG